MTIRFGTAATIVLLLGISPVWAQSAVATQKHSRSGQMKPTKQGSKATAPVGTTMNHDLNSPSADFSKMQAPVTELGGQYKAGNQAGPGGAAGGRGLQPAMNVDQ